MATKPPNPIEVFGWGLGGVNLVADPLMLDDSDLLVAQNIEPYREQGVAGIRKRPGLQRVVPTGTVTPGAAAAGVSASYTITTDPGNNQDANTSVLEILLGSGNILYSSDGGTTWTASTVTGLGDDVLLPNGKYTLGSGYEYLPCFGGVRVPFGDRPGTAFIIGAHTAGRILVTKTLNSGTAGGATVSTRSVAIFASGSADDTLVLNATWHRPFGDTKNYAIVITTGGKAALYAPANDEIITLPNFTSNGLATGSAGLLNNRLWVANGKFISSIDPLTESAWVDTNVPTAISDADITQMLGLAQFNGFLYAGTKQGTAGQDVHIVKGTPAIDGTCTVVTSVDVFSNAGPTYLFGPTTSLDVAADLPMYAFLVNGSLNGTLTGTDAGSSTSTTPRCIISHTAAAKWNVAKDVQNAATGFNGSSNRTVGPFTVVGSTRTVYWTGVVVDTGTQYLVLGTDRAGAGTVVLSRQVQATAPTYPLFIA